MRKIFRFLFPALLLTTVAACAVTGGTLGPSPEAQIVNGANAVAAAATVGGVLLKNGQITVTQAKGYRAILGTASEHLDAAAGALQACRSKTKSTAQTSPDPCAPTVQGDIMLAISVIAEVQKTLNARSSP